MFALGGGGYGGHDEYPLITPIVSFEFTLRCPDYPLGKTATNLFITERFDAVLARVVVTHQRIKLVFQQAPFISLIEGQIRTSTLLDAFTSSMRRNV
jgi:hypothetical protein